ncbi:hydroxylysine kinase-like [Clytia hemisphaerica]|uniref:Hydroxylysine kinase n=1 Tax=Clytia hemisphaerica TaxID=252671 RepID=A0A7M5U362_9CNID|eukprot:TCONS_00073052-protein
MDTQSVFLLDGELRIRPYVSKVQLKEIALKCFGLELDENVKPVEMVSYDDRNFRVQGRLKNDDITRKFVLKIFNFGSAPKLSMELAVDLLIRCGEQCSDYLKVSTPIKSLQNGHSTENVEFISSFDIPVLEFASYNNCTKEDLIETGALRVGTSGEVTCRHHVRLLTYLEGRVPDFCKDNLTDSFVRHWGATCARICNAFEGEAKSEGDRGGWIWNLVTCPQYLTEDYLSTCIKDHEQRKVLSSIIREFETETLPLLKKHLKMSYIHNDLNEANLLVSANDSIDGVLDFDDIAWSFPVVDLGICMMYLSLASQEEDIFHNLNLLYKGFTSTRCLNDVEDSALYNICLLRYAEVTVISLYQHEFVDPDNDYLLLHTADNFKRIDYLRSAGPTIFKKRVCSED